MALLDVDIGRCDPDEILNEMEKDDIITWLEGKPYMRGLRRRDLHPLAAAYVEGTLSLSACREIEGSLDALHLVVERK